MSEQIQTIENNTPVTVSPEIIESLVLNGDLSKMSGEQKVQYYNSFCKSLGLNPLTQPFEIINLKGKLRMYAKKDATDQLRNIYGVSVTKLDKEAVGDIYMVTAHGTNREGRTDSAVGAVSITGLTGENLANAVMKAESKAKRRLTLSLCGLGILDETEVDSIQKASTQEKQVQQSAINIDVIDPNIEANQTKYSQMLDAVNAPNVPDNAFSPLSKSEFVEGFKSELSAGTMTVEKADKIYNFILSFFQR